MTAEKIWFSARDGVRLEGLEQTPPVAHSSPVSRPSASYAGPGLETLSAEGEASMRIAAVPPGAAAGVVIAHSHPLQAGGHMYAHVLRAVAAELVQRGFVVLRFNFRGVQGSAGAFGDGRDELHDVGGAVDYLRSRPTIAADNIALFGYSFGSRVCLPYAAGDARIRAVATLGMPARRFLHSTPAVDAPVLLVVGSADHVLPPEHLARFLALFPSASARVLPGADHFYRGRESEVGAAVADFLERLML